MTSAAGFEIASAGHSALGKMGAGPSLPGKGQGHTSISGAIFTSAVTGTDSSSTKGTDAGSFRTGWQNLLASMDGGDSTAALADGSASKDTLKESLKNASGQGASSQSSPEASPTASAGGSIAPASETPENIVAALPSSLPVQAEANQASPTTATTAKTAEALLQQWNLTRSSRYIAGASATGTTSASQGNHTTRESKKDAASAQTPPDAASIATAQVVDAQAAQQPANVVLPAVNAAPLPQAETKATAFALPSVNEQPSARRGAQSSSSLPAGNTEFAAAQAFEASSNAKSAAKPAATLQTASDSVTPNSTNTQAPATSGQQPQATQQASASASQWTSPAQIGAFASSGRALRDQQVESNPQNAQGNMVQATETHESAISQASRLATTSFSTASTEASTLSSTATDAAPSSLSSDNSNENSPIVRKQSVQAELTSSFTQESSSTVAQRASSSTTSASVSTTASLSESQPQVRSQVSLGSLPAKQETGKSTANPQQTAVRQSVATQVQSPAIATNPQSFNSPTQVVAATPNAELSQSRSAIPTRSSKSTGTAQEEMAGSASSTTTAANARNLSNQPGETISTSNDAVVAASPVAPVAPATVQASAPAEPSASTRNERTVKASGVKSVRSASASSETAAIAHTQVQAAVTGTGVSAGPSPASTAVLQGNHKINLASGAAVSDGASTTTKTFEALDAATPADLPTWVSTGTRQAEAGYKDPELGWVGVQAKSSGGSVHASIVPGSTSAADALSGHLEGLNAFLAEHRTTVETVTVAAPESRSTGLGMDHGASQQMNHQGQGTGQEAMQQMGAGAGQGSGQGASSDAYFAAPAVATARTSADSSAVDGGASVAESPAANTETASDSGVHISVVA